MPLAVALRSLANVHPSARVFILHDRIAIRQQTRLTMTLPSSLQLRWIDVDTSSLDHVPVPDYLNRCALFRLCMGEVLPADVDRLLYLDADTVLCEPLDELWGVDLGDHVLAAVRDAAVPWVGAPRGLPWRTLGLEPDTPYFNTGVMIVSLTRWRRESIGRRALDLLATHEFRWPDQCALNAVLRGNWQIMKPIWNMQAAHVAEEGSLGWIVENRADMAKALKSPAVVHFNFSTMNRPWQPLCRHPQRQRWLDVLDTTAWAGWRPKEPRGTMAAGISRRLRRTLRVLLKGE
jgi:lipopolysaccharide biosynthesis glycosyltransferase